MNTIDAIKSVFRQTSSILGAAVACPALYAAVTHEITWEAATPILIGAVIAVIMPGHPPAEVQADANLAGNVVSDAVKLALALHRAPAGATTAVPPSLLPMVPGSAGDVAMNAVRADAIARQTAAQTAHNDAMAALAASVPVRANPLDAMSEASRAAWEEYLAKVSTGTAPPLPPSPGIATPSPVLQAISAISTVKQAQAQGVLS